MENALDTTTEHDTPLTDRQRTKLKVRLRALARLAERTLALLEQTDPLAEVRRPSAADQVLAILSAPGGMLRTQAQLAAICGIKDRTVAWAMNKLRKADAVVRSKDARWSTTEAHLSFSKTTGEDRVDAYLLNELEWRFRNPRLVHDFGRDLHMHPEIGSPEKYAASLNRLAMAGRVSLDAAGKPVRPAGVVPHGQKKEGVTQ